MGPGPFLSSLLEGALQAGNAFFDCARPSPWAWSGRGKREAECLLELNDPMAGVGLAGDDGQVELVGEDLPVDPDALFLSPVQLVEDHQGGKPGVNDLQNEIEMSFEACGIHHADDEIRCRLSLQPAQQDVAGHLLVRRVGGERVGARQVDDLELLAVGSAQCCAGPLHGNAGIVAHLAILAGKRIEEGGLARIRVPDKGHLRQRTLLSGFAHVR